MPAPIFSLPTSGTDPKVTTKAELEGAVQEAVDALYDGALIRAQILAASIKTTPVGDDVITALDSADGSAPVRFALRKLPVSDPTQASFDALAGVATSGSSDDLTEGSAKKLMTVAERAKLAGVEAGAEVNNLRAEALGATIKAAPIGNDVLVGLDSENSSGLIRFALEKLPVSNPAQAALDGKVGTGDARLSDAREWTGATVSNEDVDAGISTARRAWTVAAVWRAAAAWWAASAAKSKLDGIDAGATANATDAELRSRSSHSGTQAIGTVSGLQDALDGKATVAQGVKADSAVQPADLDPLATLDQVDTLISSVETSWRPGQVPTRYAYPAVVADLSGAPASLTDVPIALVLRVTGRGDVVRLSAPDAILSERSLIAMAPETVTEVVAIVRRIVNTSDPNGDTVRIAVRWLDATFAALGSDVIDDVVLTVEMGAWRGSATISREVDLGADLIAPASAVYARLYVQPFGSGGQTDVETLGHQDCTRLQSFIQSLNLEA